MADIDDKFPENVPGKYYVDEECIDCDACSEAAPDFFGRNDEKGYSLVCKQPEDSANGVAWLRRGDQPVGLALREHDVELTVTPRIGSLPSIAQ